MDKDKTGKKTAAGCLLVIVLFFVLVVCQCSEEKQTRQAKQKQEVKHSTSAPFEADTIMRRNKAATNTFSPTSDEDTDGDPYDNPDFDDLIPGEEYDEEFVDRSEGDRELYDEQD